MIRASQRGWPRFDVIRDRDRGIGPTGDDDPHPGGRACREQASDAVRARACRYTAVLVEPVYDQHEPLAGLGAGSGGFLEQGQQVGVAVAFAEDRADMPDRR